MEFRGRQKAALSGYWHVVTRKLPDYAKPAGWGPLITLQKVNKQPLTASYPKQHAFIFLALHVVQPALDFLCGRFVMNFSLMIAVHQQQFHLVALV